MTNDNNADKKRQFKRKMKRIRVVFLRMALKKPLPQTIKAILRGTAPYALKRKSKKTPSYSGVVFIQPTIKKPLPQTGLVELNNTSLFS